MSAEMKPGYKQTEVGVIPEDWDVAPMGEVFNISGGLSASRDQLGGNGHCYLHYGDIHTSSKTYIDVDKQRMDIPKLDVHLGDVPIRSILLDGDIVFVDASEDDEGTSKHQVVCNPRGIPFISGLHTIVVKSKRETFANNYKRHCFQTRSIKDQFRFYAVGTKVSGISKTNITKILLPIPPLPEQEAIAEALSDADALIESLEQLIAKKRHLKQGAMQELLTGKKRLPGFSGEWEVKRLGDVARLINGFAFKSNTYSPLGEYKIVTIANVQDGFMDLAECNKICTIPSNMQPHQRLQRDEILISMTGNVGRVCRVNEEDCLLNQRVGKLVSTGIDNAFLFISLGLRSFFAAMIGKAKGGAQGNLSVTDITEYYFMVPSLRAEQTAIATILSDMDAEIDALEAKLYKARQIKQGMMQELLTGKIRLAKLKMENG